MNTSNEEYVAKGGNCCPNCGSTQLTGGPISVDGIQAIQEVFCNNCGASWADVYDLVGYTEMEVPHAPTP